MTWLDSRFVQKDSKESEEIFSDQANLFKEIKRIVSSFDPEMDNYLLQHPHEMDDLAEMMYLRNCSSNCQNKTVVTRSFRV